MLTGSTRRRRFARLLAAYVVFGLGFGFVNAPITNAAVSGMPRAQAGVAAAIATTSRQFGQTLGVAVVGAIVASHAAGRPLTAASHPAGGRSRPAARSCSCSGSWPRPAGATALGAADRGRAQSARRSCRDDATAPARSGC